MKYGNFNKTEKQAYYLTKDILSRTGKNIEDIRCNINSFNYFDILLMYPLLRLKLRGNKDYIVNRQIYGCFLCFFMFFKNHALKMTTENVD